MNIVLFKITLHVGGVFATHLYVGAKPVKNAHLFLCGKHIGGPAAVGVQCNKANHVAHFKLWVLLVCQLYGGSTGNKLVMQGLKPHGGVVRASHHVAAIPPHRAKRKRIAHRHRAAVDLVKGQPVGDFVFVALKNGAAIPRKVVNALPPGPAIIGFYQSIRHFVMRNSHQWLNAVLVAFVQNIVVELQAGLVGLVLHTGGEDAGPCNRKAEAPKPHFRHQCNVLFVMVVKVNGFMAGVKSPLFHRGREALWGRFAAAGAKVRHGNALAVQVPPALQLVCGNGPAP
ncbi:hypothetical protein SDC9_138568 [bioreactor metagenome]|uniref:Uncharacterized protein n=1 Tax=bioreactor metagenome TaxID=1076179 RepID=A0A645DQB4_9ZZZZ